MSDKNYQKEWARNNPDKIRAAKARHNSKPSAKAKAREYSRKWRAKNRQRDRENRRRWRDANPDKIHAQYIRQKLAKGVVGDPTRHRRNALQRAYKMSVAEYEALLVAQGSRCAICGSDSGNKRGHALFIDHCHSTGRVRGLLCNRCNSALGYLNDSPTRLRRAAAYLENWRGKTVPD